MLEKTKEVISKKDRQYNGQIEKQLSTKYYTQKTANSASASSSCSTNNHRRVNDV